MKNLAVLSCCLLAVLLLQQISCGPVPSRTGGQSDLEDRGVLKRSARMTPLWRVMGNKPFGAYCQDHVECSTGICKGGHCIYSQPIKS
uniref:Liver-expressed antimicrobial peptide 2B n=1 Tax=Plecoglossus altivelis TaxID=61084 RepID=A0A0E3IEQ0_PLEAT|nr:liver-expressed antimicrobial peptide 2B precursor [Plecoglossus altivelis]